MGWLGGNTSAGEGRKKVQPRVQQKSSGFRFKEGDKLRRNDGAIARVESIDVPTKGPSVATLVFLNKNDKVLKRDTINPCQQKVYTII